MLIFDTLLTNNVVNMSELRKRFKDLRKYQGIKQNFFGDIMSRHTVRRFENGGDVTLSKFEKAVEKMGKRVIILM